MLNTENLSAASCPASGQGPGGDDWKGALGAGGEGGAVFAHLNGGEAREGQQGVDKVKEGMVVRKQEAMMHYALLPVSSFCFPPLYHLLARTFSPWTYFYHYFPFSHPFPLLPRQE